MVVPTSVATFVSIQICMEDIFDVYDHLFSDFVHPNHYVRLVQLGQFSSQSETILSLTFFSPVQ